MKISNHFKYLCFILKHKWFVFQECCRNKIYWRGFTHDLDKFLPKRWFSYVNFTYSKDFKRDETGYFNPIEAPDINFVNSWFLHAKYNEHHWQYWILCYENEKIKVFPMSRIARLEMLSDWWGASKAHGRGGWEGVKVWYKSNKKRMLFHPETQKEVELFLNER